MTRAKLRERLTTDQEFRKVLTEHLVERLLEEMDVDDMAEQLTWYISAEYREMSVSKLGSELEAFQIDADATSRWLDQQHQRQTHAV